VRAPCLHYVPAAFLASPFRVLFYGNNWTERDLVRTFMRSAVKTAGVYCLGQRHRIGDLESKPESLRVNCRSYSTQRTILPTKPFVFPVFGSTKNPTIWPMSLIPLMVVASTALESFTD
jgi:hypothetical protein